MMRVRVRIAALATCLLIVLAWTAMSSHAIDSSDILKVLGVAFLVSQYGEQIDNFITNALGEQAAAARGATKVVPILSLGGGGYGGAAQVVGNPEHVRVVKAVIQAEGRFGDGRAQLLIPTTTENPSGMPSRAPGVGVSAVVEFDI